MYNYFSNKKEFETVEINFREGCIRYVYVYGDYYTIPSVSTILKIANRNKKSKEDSSKQKKKTDSFDQLFEKAKEDYEPIEDVSDHNCIYDKNAHQLFFELKMNRYN